MIKAQSTRGHARRTLYVDLTSIGWTARNREVKLTTMNNLNNLLDSVRMSPDTARELADELIAAADAVEERAS